MNQALQNRRRGASLLDIMVASVILGLLLFALFSLFRTGVVGLKKVDNQSSLLRELQILSLKIGRAAHESSFDSLSVSPDQTIVAFLSAEDGNGDFIADDLGRPVWQKFIVYYLQTSDNTIYRTEVPYTATDPSETTTYEDYSGGTLPALVGSGDPRPLAKNITFCRWERLSPALLSFQFQAERQRYQSDDFEKKSLTSTVKLRN